MEVYCLVGQNLYRLILADYITPKRDMRYVAAAGPLANLLMALGWGILHKLATLLPESSFTLPMLLMAAAGISTNLMFMVLNLLPIPPLDGGEF